MTQGGTGGVVRSHLMIEGCDSYVTTRCHVMSCEYEALSRRREPLTGQVQRRGVLSPRVNTQPVSHTRFTLSPLLTHFTFTIYTHTLTLVWLNYPSSFQTAFLHSIQLQFDFFFSFNLVCCTHLVFILPLFCVTAFFFSFYQLPVLYYTFSLYVFIPTFKTQPPFSLHVFH